MTLIWTALPAGLRRDGDGEWLARVTVFLSPRLDVTADEAPLSVFPEFVDWPKTLRDLEPDGIEFLLEMHDGETVVASVNARPAPRVNEESAPDSQAWRGIFEESLPVVPFAVPEDRDSVGFAVQSYNARGVVQAIRDVYGQAVAEDAGIVTEPPTLTAFNIPANRFEAPTSTNDRNPIEDFVRFHQLAEDGDAAIPKRTAGPCPDFHQIVAATGTHPLLMRRLGLVIDLDVPVSELGLDGASQSLRLRVRPRNAAFDETIHRSPWTSVGHDTATSDRYRVFRAAANGRLGAGLYAFDRAQPTIVQEKLEHAAFALVQQARAAALKTDDETTGPLPALLQGGMRLTHPDKPLIMQGAMGDQFGLEQSLQVAIDRVRSGLLGADDAEDILTAEHVTRGYRVDVREIESGTWRSLCRREVRYRTDDWSWPAAAATLEDEGVVEPTVFTDGRDPSAEPRTNEDLFEWDGWSLVVPHPDRSDEETAQPSTDCGTSLSIRLAVPGGSLVPQRFGRCYQFRLRPVDLAGNSLSAEEADALEQGSADPIPVTDPVCYLRVESAKPPVVFPGTPRGAGEAGDVIVLRDAESDAHRTDEFRLHVVPPEVPLRIAEKHGVFDGLTTAESWRMISEHRGALDREDGEAREWISAPTFYTPYLPDPIVKQATLTLPDGGETVDLPRFDDLPRSVRGRELARSCQLVVRPGRDRARARVSGREVVLEVPKGRAHTVHIAAKLSVDDLSVLAFAHPDWYGGDTDSLDRTRQALADAAARGDAPVIAPSRPVTIVHATQRPLQAPVFGRPLILPRQADSTSAVLADDAMQFDRPSTGRIDVYAEWQDPVDDPADDGWSTSRGALHAGGVRIGEDDGKPLDPLELAESARAPMAHDFGDTRHHEVTYRAQATSRFVEFYPVSLTQDPDDVALWSEPATLHVPSTAPPAAPDIAYVIPTFRAGETHRVARNIDERTAERQGEGLRVYMNRGWFSSGVGEKLALVVATTPDLPETLEGVVTEWGVNPLRDSAPLPGPLQMEHVWNGIERIAGWPLDSGTVGLVIHDVQFSKEHKLPFVDIAFMAQRAFMPLVRLAVARYQEHAIETCKLSSIVHADFVPLAPGRAITIRKIAEASWALAIRGYSYADSGPDPSFDQTSVVQAQIEIMPRDQPEDPAAWRALGDPVHLQPETLEPWRYHWRGQLRVDDPQHLSRLYRRRIVVQEFEPFETAGAPDIPLADRARLLSAHAVPI
ncbi:MAG: hypothetical protein GY798_10405 [Hyphomicrobiales bacterium]|nr:hypothetical protein [Hyphomicrobiales bacterium]